jgi:hypothetical protein
VNSKLVLLKVATVNFPTFVDITIRRWEYCVSTPHHISDLTPDLIALSRPEKLMHNFLVKVTPPMLTVVYIHGGPCLTVNL